MFPNPITVGIRDKQINKRFKEINNFKRSVKKIYKKEQELIKSTITAFRIDLHSQLDKWVPKISSAANRSLQESITQLQSNLERDLTEKTDTTLSTVGFLYQQEAEKIVSDFEKLQAIHDESLTAQKTCDDLIDQSFVRQEVIKALTAMLDLTVSQNPKKTFYSSLRLRK